MYQLISFAVIVYAKFREKILFNQTFSLYYRIFCCHASVIFSLLNFSMAILRTPGKTVMNKSMSLTVEQVVVEHFLRCVMSKVAYYWVFLKFCITLS